MTDQPVITTAQLVAALSMLGMESITTRAEVQWRRFYELRDNDLDHAMTAGLLYRFAGAITRQSIVSASDMAMLEARAAAASPRNVQLANENVAEQAIFEAFWLADRIAAVQSHSSAEVSVGARILDAAWCAAEAAKILLRIHRELSSGRRLEASRPDWEALLQQLAAAHHYARLALVDVETNP
ncbi:hypothetical protein [Nocardia nepalensis]|uniref:hypothetical protein n=1 Tax=Nocardia nepalensis TaxID=3375448 RepID=UPI003B66E901